MKDRRDILKGLAVGPIWATPVVSSVVLPVHAGTTCEEISRTISCTGSEDSELCAHAYALQFNFEGGLGICEAGLPGEFLVTTCGDEVVNIELIDCQQCC